MAFFFAGLFSVILKIPSFNVTATVSYFPADSIEGAAALDGLSSPAKLCTKSI